MSPDLTRALVTLVIALAAALTAYAKSRKNRP